MSELRTFLKEARWSDVVVRGDPGRIDLALDHLDSHLPSGWIRDKGREQRLKDANIWQTGTRIYSFSDSGGHAIASIAVCRVEPCFIKAGQTVPLGKANFERTNGAYQPFQECVIEFMDRVFRPAVEAVGLLIDFQTRPHPLDSELDPTARRALQDFVEAAPKAVSRFRDEDRRRWQSFLIALHRARSFPHRAALEDWLTRQNFSESDAVELGQDYSRGLTLLEEYEEERQQSWR